MMFKRAASVIYFFFQFVSEDVVSIQTLYFIVGLFLVLTLAGSHFTFILQKNKHNLKKCLLLMVIFDVFFTALQFICKKKKAFKIKFKVLLV